MTARRNRRCGHCSLLGHYIHTCHVLAEGRTRPDAADVLACKALLGHRVELACRGAVAQMARDLLKQVR